MGHTTCLTAINTIFFGVNFGIREISEFAFLGVSKVAIWMLAYCTRVACFHHEDRAGELARLLQERRRGLRLLHHSCMPSNVALKFMLDLLLLGVPANFSTCKKKLQWL